MDKPSTFFLLALLLVVTLVNVNEVFAFDRINIAIEEDSSRIIDNIKPVCNSYCESDINYFNGKYDSIRGRCIYEKLSCEYGCTDTGTCAEKTNIIDLNELKNIPELETIDKNIQEIIDINIIEKNDVMDISNIKLIIKKGPLAYVANGNIIIIDTKSHEQIATINLKYKVDNVAISPDDSILYAIGDNKELLEGTGYVDRSYLTLINTTTNEEIANIDLGYMKRTYALSVAPDGKVYVSWKGSWPGYNVFDFENNKQWSKTFYDQYQQYLATSIAFDNTGSKAYMTMQGGNPTIYMIDWNTNQAFRYPTQGYVYALDSLEATRNAETFYFMGNGQKKIGYLRTSDHTYQRWYEDYEVKDLAYSQDKKALYAIGNKDGILVLNKMTGLMGISAAYPVETTNYMVSDSSSFYTSNKRVTLNFPKNSIPGRITLSPNDNFIYVTNMKLDTVGGTNYYEPGNLILVYEPESLVLIKAINMNFSMTSPKIAIAKNPIAWDPSTNFIISGNLVSNPLKVIEVIGYPYVTESNPGNGTINVPIDSSLQVMFSEEIDSSTVNSENFIVLNSHSYPIKGMLSSYKKSVTFIPEENYSKNSKVFFTITNRIKSIDGSSAIWTHYEFTTGNDSKASELTIQKEIVNIESEVIMEAVKIQNNSLETFELISKGNNKDETFSEIENIDSQENTEQKNYMNEKNQNTTRTTVLERISNFFKRVFRR